MDRSTAGADGDYANCAIYPPSRKRRGKGGATLGVVKMKGWASPQIADRRFAPLLASAVLRFSGVEREEAGGEARLHPP